MKGKGKAAGLYHYSGLNPFKDGQSRTFSDDKVLEEFCPTSAFWSLFNDQHEVILGTRGSGKTILLRMMRFSLLKKIQDEKAAAIIAQKRHIGIYVPLNLEFLGSFSYQEIPETVRLPYFQFAFNCMLAQSFLYEVNSIIEETPNIIEQAIKSVELAGLISPIWFPDKPQELFSSLDEISNYINEMYYSCDVRSDSLPAMPKVFLSPICTPVQSVKSCVSSILGLANDANWVVCIDEAEFLDDIFQKCINTIFRSDSRGVVIKMATLPFKHTTKETLTKGVFAEANGNDFNYTFLDMKHDHHDFINVTNKICSQRICKSVPDLNGISSLDDFLGKVGGDDLVDYYRAEVEADNNKVDIEAEIFKSLSGERQDGVKAKGKKSLKKSIFDKFAPIYFCREMFNRSRRGNHTPGWFAGPRMVRRVSEGNPRLFLQLMNDLFEHARNHSLTFKAQHKVTHHFASRICEATKGLPIHGPNLSIVLDKIACILQSKTHDGHLVDSGNDFAIAKLSVSDEELIGYLKLGIQYARLTADSHTIIDGVSEGSTFSVSNCYCVRYWIPMRKGTRPVIDFKNDKKGSGNTNDEQGCLF